MKFVAIVQARMGSARLPGKILLNLGGESALARVVRRLRRASRIERILVATTDSPQDDPVVRACEQLGVEHYRGSEHDVLGRYLQAAEQVGYEAVVRITADCPLIDPEVVDQTICVFEDENADIACNDLPRTFPRGLDVEVFTLATLRKAAEIATEPYQREHVTPVINERPDLFRRVSVCGAEDFSHYRWTLDTPEDLLLIRNIYSHFDNRDNFGWREVAALMQRFPDLQLINAHIVQKQAREAEQVRF